MREGVRGPHGTAAAAIAVFYVFLWASAYVPSKIASVESPPLWFLAARFLAAGTILAQRFTFSTPDISRWI